MYSAAALLALQAILIGSPGWLPGPAGDFRLTCCFRAQNKRFPARLRRLRRHGWLSVRPQRILLLSPSPLT